MVIHLGFVFCTLGHSLLIIPVKSVLAVTMQANKLPTLLVLELISFHSSLALKVQWSYEMCLCNTKAALRLPDSTGP